MQRKLFGTTGRSLGVVGLGGMPLSLEGRPSEVDGIRVVHAALDHGMTLIDTADVYCIDDEDIGHNERLIASALARWSGARDEVLVATKGGLRRPRGDWVTDGRPEHLRQACDRSLKALGVSTIALYQLHAPDDDVPFADSVGELARLRTDGKIQHVGLSNVTAAQIVEASRIVPIASVQNRCNPFDLRAFRNGVVARCEADGLAFLPYSPVGGWRDKTRIENEPTLLTLGARHEATTYQVALAWLLRKSPVMFPIPGASRIESAVSSAMAPDLKLTSQDESELDRAFNFSK